jgi:hypothetical protein
VFLPIRSVGADTVVFNYAFFYLFSIYFYYFISAPGGEATPCAFVCANIIFYAARVF